LLCVGRNWQSSERPKCQAIKFPTSHVAPSSGGDSVAPATRLRVKMRLDVAVGSMLLKKGKMNWSKILPVCPSKPVIRNPKHHGDLAEATD
jgi:hypothetical protein